MARRFVNAKLDPTFLMADVEIVATYELYNINRTRLENLIHRIFGAARLDIEIKDRSGIRLYRASGSLCHFSSSTKPSNGSRTAL